MLKKMISQLLVKILVRKSKIIEKHVIANRFVFLKIKMPKKVTWIPGDKVQIVVGAKDLRSYTPYTFDLDQKTFSTLIYNHGNGPGALWANSVATSARTEVFGPRRSFVDQDDDHMYLFFGDETSMGLAYALRLRLYHAYFEVNNEKLSALALHYLTLTPFSLFERRDNLRHINSIVEQMTLLLSTNRHQNFLIILSGHKWSAEYLEAALLEIFHRLEITNARIIKKHYWGHKDQQKTQTMSEQMNQETTAIIS